MTVQELREEIVQKTEEINGYLESRDADKAEEALAEKRKLQKLLAVREAEDDEGRPGKTEETERKQINRSSKRVESCRKICFAWKGSTDRRRKSCRKYRR